MQLLKPVTYSNESGRNPSLQVIDQIQISQKNNVVYIPIDSVQSAWNVLRKGQVCGEPWSAIVATISVALDLVGDTEAGSSSESILRIIDQKVDHLRKSRPTDGALFHSLDKLMEACHKGVAELDMTSWNLENAVTTFGSIKEMTSCKAMLVKVILSFGEMMIWSNSNIHLALGEYGSATIRDDMVKKQKNGRGIHLLTIGTLSNVSGLGYYGAASAPFSVVQALMERNFLPSMAVLDINSTFLIPPTETFEYMVFEKDSATDFTVISNPMTVATYIQQNPVDAILVGALHICASTGYALTPAGTYQLACIAQGHGVPFYVVAPLASISTSTQTDDWNVDANTVPYNTKDGHCLTSQANPTVCSWNPILDVTPASFITAIVTEQGVIQKEQNHDATFPIMKFIDENGGRILSSISTLSPEVTTLKNASLAKRISGNFIRFTVHSIVSYLETNCPQVMEELGATTSFNVTAKEIGTGEFNLVFIVTNKADTEKKVIAKQVRNHVYYSSCEVCALFFCQPYYVHHIHFLFLFTHVGFACY
jgi:methylthioribose-1-phosphate isomerase